MKFGEEAVFSLLDILNENGIPYMLVGSFSSNAYGQARATNDADFVVQLKPDERTQVLKQLPTEFEIDFQTSFETVTGHTRQILKIPSIPFEIELFDLSDEAFDQSRFTRRVKTTMEDRTVWLPTAEDVLLQKMRWATLANREKDRLDARSILEVRGETLDWEYVNHWADILGVSSDLESLVRSVREK